MPKNKFTIPFVCLSLLLIPLMGKQFTDAIQWTVFDFALMGILLWGLGLGLRWVLYSAKSPQHKRTYAFLLILLFLLLWAELAVGVFGSPVAGS